MIFICFEKPFNVKQTETIHMKENGIDQNNNS